VAVILNIMADRAVPLPGEQGARFAGYLCRARTRSQTLTWRFTFARLRCDTR
jgi:hypothetical protein